MHETPSGDRFLCYIAFPVFISCCLHYIEQISTDFLFKVKERDDFVFPK